MTEDDTEVLYQKAFQDLEMAYEWSHCCDGRFLERLAELERKEDELECLAQRFDELRCDADDTSGKLIDILEYLKTNDIEIPDEIMNKMYF